MSSRSGTHHIVGTTNRPPADSLPVSLPQFSDRYEKDLVFLVRPFCFVEGGIEGILPSVSTLVVVSSWDECAYVYPGAVEYVHGPTELVVLFWRPYTVLNVWIKSTRPPALALSCSRVFGYMASHYEGICQQRAKENRGEDVPKSQFSIPYFLTASMSLASVSSVKT